MENEETEPLYEGFEPESIDEDQEYVFREYDISAAPNDFNIKTLFDFISSGIVKIPGFQRNYVWDIKRASRLVESIILGIPIPQIFLYQEEKNRFIVIDGQQRYMTIYYFIKKRFPRQDRRLELRGIFDKHKGIPDNIINDDAYFVDFNLLLPEKLPDQPNPLNKKNYFTLEEEIRTSFDYKTIRNIIIKENLQTGSEDDKAVVYEIFQRLNSGGVNLTPQEIRSGLFHSEFYDLLYELNLDPTWRRCTPSAIPDIHMRDIEILLRGFALLVNRDQYRKSMTKFLNKFSKEAKNMSDKKREHFRALFLTFIQGIAAIDEKVFFSKGGRFNISIYEAVFYACAKDAVDSEQPVRIPDAKRLTKLKQNEEFIEAARRNTADTKKVNLRLDIAVKTLFT